MNKQEIFNTVWDHFIVQENHPGWDFEREQCMYKTNDGHSCAVGVILANQLPAEHALWQVRGPIVEVLRQFGDQTWTDFLREHEYFLVSLQRAHDDSAADAVEAAKDAEGRPPPTLDLGHFQEIFKYRLGNVADSHELGVLQ